MASHTEAKLKTVRERGRTSLPEGKRQPMTKRWKNCEQCGRRFYWTASPSTQPRKFCSRRCSAKKNADQTRKKPDKETLRRWYVIEQLGLKEISERCGYSTITPT